MATYADSVAIRERFLGRLANLEDDATQQLVRAYAVTLDRIEADIARALETDAPLGRAIRETFDGAEDTARIAVLRGRAEFIAGEFDRFAANGAAAVRTLAPNAFRLGIDEAGDQVREIAGSFTRPNRRQIEQAVARLQQGTSLGGYFDQFAIGSTQQAMDQLVSSVVLGEGPEKIVRGLRDKMNLGTTRLRTMVRTEVLGAARAGIADSYRANSDVIAGWIWNADQSPTTCEVCWAMNGTLHDLDEDLHSHPNCRCVQTPTTRTFDEIAGDFGFGETGAVETRAETFDPDERFDRVLSDAEKIRVLGPGKYALYRDGQIRLADLVTPTFSEKWGPGLRATTLRELRQRGVSPPSVVDQVAAGAAREITDVPTSAQPWRNDFDAAADEFYRYDLPRGADGSAWFDFRNGLGDDREAWELPDGSPGRTAQEIERKLSEAGRIIDDEIERRVLSRVGQETLDAANEFAAIERELILITTRYNAAWKEWRHAGQLYARNPNTRNSNRLDRAEAEFRSLEERKDELLRRRDEAWFGDAQRNRVLRIQQEEARAVLSEIRDWGQGRLTFRGEVPEDFLPAIDAARGAFPTEWIDGVPEYRWLRTRRGYHSVGKREIALSGNGSDLTDVAMHELGHAMEASRAGIRFLEWVFYYRRTDAINVKARNMPGYDKDEWFREDEFLDFYCGRDYVRKYGASERPEAFRSTEIMSMGVEALFGTRSPQVVWRDDDYRRFVLGVLALL